MKIIAFDHVEPEHIESTLTLVRGLTQGGDQVIYHAGPTHRDAITSAGAQFRNYGYDELRFADFNPKANTTLALLPAAVGLWPTLSAEIASEKPDLIIYDARALWGRCLAAAYAIPSVCIIPSFATTRFERLDMLRENGLSLDAANRAALRRVHELAGLRLDITDALGCYGTHAIVLTSPALNAPPLDYAASHFHFVGPIGAAEAQAEPDAALARFLDSGQTNVYVSATDNAVIQAAVAAFAGQDAYRVVLELGRAADPAKLGLPGSVFARARVPRQQVLQRAHVFITHADAASVNDGAAAAVPMIAIPRSDDQFFNARLIAGRGIGMTLAADGLTPDALREAVDALRDNASTVSTCQHIRGSFEQLGGVAEALAVLRRAADPLDHVAGEQAASRRALRVGAKNQTMTITDGRHGAAEAD